MWDLSFHVVTVGNLSMKFERKKRKGTKPNVEFMSFTK